MNLPEVVQTRLDDEDPVARVDLGGEDELFVTPTRTMVYRAEGLLSDEYVEEYDHEVERITVSEGRRKAKVTLDYGLGGTEEISLPAKHLDAALHPVLAGVLSAVDITDPGESVERTFRFSELTLIVTSARVVKHIGAAVWDEDFEEYHFDDVTDLAFEDGSVATSVVFTLGNRQERFKAPNEEARAVREALTAALLAHHGAGSLEEFRAAIAEEADESAADDPESDPFGDGPDPLSADPADLTDEPANATRGAADSANGAVDADGPSTEGVSAALAEVAEDASTASEAGTVGASEASTSVATETDGDTSASTDERRAEATETESDAFEGSPFESPGIVGDEAVADELAALRKAVERQQEQLERQSELVDQLVTELRRSR